VSAAVIWEIRIKQALGKLEIPANFRNVLDQQGFEMLDVTVDHAYAVGDLPSHHRDPFDRILVAQAKLESLTLVTHDISLRKYKIPLINAWGFKAETMSGKVPASGATIFCWGSVCPMLYPVELITISPGRFQLSAILSSYLSAACLPYFWQVFVADELKKVEFFSKGRKSSKSQA